MTFFEKLLLSALVASAIVNIGNWRAWLWLTVGALNYLITSAYYDAGLPLHPAFTAGVDAMVCIAIWQVVEFRGGQAWELPLFTAFWLSTIGGFFALVGTIPAMADGAVPITPKWYYSWLEGCNWIALLVIFGAGATRAIDALDHYLGHPLGWGGLHRFVRATHAPKKIDWLWFARWAIPPR